MSALSLSARVVRRIERSHATMLLERDFERAVGSHPTLDGGAGPVIGFATFGSGRWHFVIEALLAQALAVRGARPHMLICDLPGLPVCSERACDSSSVERCAGCLDDKRRLIEIAGVPWRGVSAFTSAGALDRARAMVAALPDGELDTFAHRGWPLGKWIYVSACHYLRADANGTALEKRDVRRRLLTSAIVLSDAFDRWLDEVRPARVIAESGAHLEWRIALELSRARGIPVVCREMGKGGWDHHIYALNADSMSPNLDHEWSRTRSESLTPREDAEVSAFIAELPARTFVPPVSSQPRPRAMPGGSVAVLFTNVTWDLATAGRDAGFTGVRDWVNATIGAFQRSPAAHLMVRAHPAEASVGTRERIADQIRRDWPALPPNVSIIEPEDPVRSTELIEAGDLVLVYNSTSGLEAAAHGRPVMVAGAPHFRGRGFTIDASTREEYASLLAQWQNGEGLAPPPLARELARRYVHLFYKRYHIPMGWTTSPLAPPFELTIRSRAELVPGSNASLDEVCSGILEARQILLPRAPAERTVCNR